MMLTIVLITLGTLGLALTPTFESIGMAAPVLVVICRLVQGLALGGEVGPSLVLAGLNSISAAASLVTIPELLPTRVRSTDLSLAYAIGVALFGGSTQFVFTWLRKVSGNPIAPARYLVGTGLVSTLAMLALPESRHAKLAASETPS